MRIALLLLLAPLLTASASAAADDLFEAGERAYASCVSCHEEDGSGVDGIGPSLHGSEWVLGDPELLVRIILDGIEGPIEVDGELWDDFMPGFRRDRRLNDHAIAALVTYVRGSWDHDEDGIEPETVAAIREATADRSTSYTVEELRALAEE